ncbi:hypothetical protein HK101_000422, partial [Irineochytrium annulatum]
MLQARSDYFRRLFSQPPSNLSLDPTNPPIVDLTVLDPDAFRIVRRFLYTAEEEDEATSPTSTDWRLVLECFRVTDYLGVQERSPAYRDSFVAMFHRFASQAGVSSGVSYAGYGHHHGQGLSLSHSEDPRETCREMWMAADAYRLDDLLVGTATSFWRLFGGEQHRAELGRVLGTRLETLIKVINAIPRELEPPIGRFRLVRSWMMGRNMDEEDVNDDEVTAGNDVGRNGNGRSVARKTSMASSMNGYATAAGNAAPSSAGVSPLSPTFDGGGNGGAYEDDAYPESEADDAEIRSTPSSPRSRPQYPASNISSRKRESYLSNSTTITYISNGANGGTLPRRPASIYSAGNYASLKRGEGGGGWGFNVGGGGGILDRGVDGRSNAGDLTISPRRPTLSKVLATLDLAGISATDLVDEVEPSGLLTDRHLLTLYRAAALEREQTPLWMPVPAGFAGRRFLNHNPRTGYVTLSAQARRGDVAPTSPTGSSVTYCYVEPIRA